MLQWMVPASDHAGQSELPYVEQLAHSYLAAKYEVNSLINAPSMHKHIHLRMYTFVLIHSTNCITLQVDSLLAVTFMEQTKSLYLFPRSCHPD